MKSGLLRCLFSAFAGACIWVLAGCVTVVETPDASPSQMVQEQTPEEPQVETQEEYRDRITSNIVHEVVSCSPNAIVYVTNQNDENVDVFVQVAWIHGDGVVAATASESATLIAGLTSKIYVPIPATVGSYGECQVVSVEPWSE